MQQLIKSINYILSISLVVFLLPTTQVQAATPAPTFYPTIYEWLSQSGTISADGLAHEYTNLEAGQTINLSLSLYNRSGTAIQGKQNLLQSPDKQVPMGSWGIGSQTPFQDGTPSFLDSSSFVLNNNRFVYYDGADVPNDGLITMSWNIKLKNNLADGVYNLYVRPVCEYLVWTRQMKNGQLLPTTSSDIYWRFVVGERKSYVNNDIGYTFNYLDVDGDVSVFEVAARTQGVDGDIDGSILLLGISGKKFDNDIWLYRPVLSVEEMVIVSDGGNSAHWGETPATTLAVFNKPFNLFFNNLEYDTVIPWSYAGSPDTMTKGPTSYTSSGLRYFTVSGTHTGAPGRLTSKFYAVELSSSKTVIIRADMMPYSIDTPLTLSVLNSLKTL
jgi:hypothetical protein